MLVELAALFVLALALGGVGQPATTSAPGDGDGDGLPDRCDLCPAAPEDRDGWEDQDGCPDPDNDGDGVLDVADRCPDSAGHDADGCNANGVTVTSSIDYILDVLYFDRDTARLRAASLGIAAGLASMLIAERGTQPYWQVVGHADRGERDPEGLALARAQALRDLLVQRGVEPQRLLVTGLGAREPSRTERGKRRAAAYNFLALIRPYDACAAQPR